MLAILNSLNAHNFPIFQSILMILVSKFMVAVLFNSFRGVRERQDKQ